MLSEMGFSFIARKNSRRDTKIGCALKVYLQNKCSEKNRSTCPGVGVLADPEGVMPREQ